MRKSKTNRPLGLESLESRVALASDLFITINVVWVYSYIPEGNAYRIDSISMRQSQHRKNTLLAEGEGADAPMHTSGLNAGKRDQPQAKVEPTNTAINGVFPSVATSKSVPGNALIATKSSSSNLPRDSVVDQPVAMGPSRDVYADLPRSRMGDSSLQNTSSELSTRAKLDTSNSLPTVDTIRNALKVSHEPSSTHMRFASGTLSESVMQSGVSARKPSNLAGLMDALQLRGESQGELGTTRILPGNETKVLKGESVHQTSRALETQSNLEWDRTLLFSQYDAARQPTEESPPTEWNQLTSMIGVMRSLDMIDDDVLVPCSESVSQALLAVVAELEQGTESPDGSYKVPDHRGMSTAGSILVAAYAALVARRKPNQYLKQGCDEKGRHSS